MERWYVSAKKADFNSWAEKFQISPVTARVLRNRDLTTEKEVADFLYGTLEDCHAPELMKDMDKATERIIKAVLQRERIRVIGDYDVDGICSAYILTRALQVLGADVDTAIPHRIHDGYGLNDHLIELAYNDGVRLILTCDNGIAASAQIALANDKGIDVVVTDHHEVPFVEEDGVRREMLPPASAVVNPKQEKCSYPFKNICGGVVAYKLVQALFQQISQAVYGELDEVLAKKGLFLQDTLEELLEFAALATVCDVMELRGENRILVKEGLKRLKNSKNQGLRALMEVNGLESGKLGAYHLGFVIGPCLNATGRLDTAKRALELLQSTSKTEAMSAARELKDLNDSRKNLTMQGVQEAEKYIATNHLEKDDVMVVYLPEVHESLAGIIAGRIREKYNHPVFVLTKAEDGVKGSGRSIESYHMYEAMSRVKHFFSKYGGHKLAAGLTLELSTGEEHIVERIEEFRRALNESCGLKAEDFVPSVHIDVPMPLSYASEELAAQLELLEPFGVGNPKPLFAQKELCFKAGYKMGANKSFARYRVSTPEGKQEQVVFFGDLEKFGSFLGEKFGEGSEDTLYAGRGDFTVSVTYQLARNTFRGKTELQFIMQNYC